MISVICSMVESRHLSRNLVGIGSREQDFGEDDTMISLTSDEVTSLNSSRVGPVYVVGEYL